MSFLSLRLTAFTVFFVVTSWIFQSGCTNTSSSGTAKAAETRLVLRMPSDGAASLNALTGRDLDSYHIRFQLYQPLIHYDYNAGELIPVLAKARPQITVLEEGGLRMDMEIREEATWDNGSPITGHDVAFTLKAIKCPGAALPVLNEYMDFIVDCAVDPSNPRKFSITCREKYFRSEMNLIDLWIVPAYFYDPENLLGGFTVAQLAKPGVEKTLKDDPKVLAFAELIKSDKFANQVCAGSGPYAFASWVTGQDITFKRKANWWGDKVKNGSFWFKAYPNEIVYRVISSVPAMISELKSQQLDAARSIPAKDFNDLANNAEFLSNYQVRKQDGLSWTYYTFNMRNPILSDINVRKALVNLTDWDTYNKNVLFGMGQRISGPILSTTRDNMLNPNLKPSEFSPEKAKALLAEAGWTDSNGNGTLDKKIKGKTTELKLEIIYPDNAVTFQQFTLSFQEECRKVGIAIEPKGIPAADYSERRKRRNFELYIGLWTTDPDGSDPHQLWHSSNYSNGGDNLPGFGNAESDQLIVQIQQELDIDKRRALYWQLQEMIAKEVPYAFGYSMPDRLVVHKRFTSVIFTSMSPGFWMAGSRTADQPE